MTLKQKFYSFLAVVCDYEGMHYIANSYRKGNVNILIALFDLLCIGSFPFLVVTMFILTRRFHSPNCDCATMKHIEFSNKLHEAVKKYDV